MKILSKKHVVIFLTLIISQLSASSFAAGHGEKWNLILEQSTVNFVSVKKSTIGEVHSFKEFSGVIDHNKANISIDVASVDMLIPIRSERAIKYLFEAAKFSSIDVQSDVSAAMNNAKKGETLFMDIPASLSLHGTNKDIILNVSVTRNGENSLTVASAKPIIINAADYNMDAGITKLSNFVGDIPIIKSVPVSFVLTFKKS